MDRRIGNEKMRLGIIAEDFTRGKACIRREMFSPALRGSSENVRRFGEVLLWEL